MENHTPLFAVSRFPDGREVVDIPWMEYFNLPGTGRRTQLLLKPPTRAYGTMPQGAWMTKALHDEPFGLGVVGFLLIALPVLLGLSAGALGVLLALALASPLIGLFTRRTLLDLRGEAVISSLFVSAAWTPQAAAPRLQEAVARAGQSYRSGAVSAAFAILVFGRSGSLALRGGPADGGAVIELMMEGKRNAAVHCALKAFLLEEFQLAPAEAAIPNGR
jgi:hypothetical protein